MRVVDNRQVVLAQLKKKMVTKLGLIGATVQGAAANLAPVLTGNLKNSIDYFVDENKLFVRIGTNVEYAAIIELGGVIKPKNAKALAVPVHPDAKRTIIPEGKSVRDVFPDLVMIQRPGHPPLLVRKKEKGRNKKFDIMYVLLTSVTVKPQPYLKPGFIHSKEEIMRILSE